MKQVIIALFVLASTSAFAQKQFSKMKSALMVSAILPSGWNTATKTFPFTRVITSPHLKRRYHEVH